MILGLFTGLPSVTMPVSAVSSDFIAKIDPPASGSTAISTREELEAIADNLSGTYHLTADIDLSGTPWKPIGDDSKKFTGTFDGQGYAIYNMTITGSIRYAGLFGYADGARIKNFGMEETYININSFSYAGGICGYSTGPISNCYNIGTVLSSASSSYTSGICGYSTGPISNCYNIGTVLSSSSENFWSNESYAGGICGRSNSSIINCYNTGAISTSVSAVLSSSYTGGICGYSTGSISNCYNTGIISSPGDSYAQIYAGGICGYNGAISNCYNIGSVSAERNAGGICGYNGTISNCYNTGSISAFSTYTASYAGGICGLSGNTSFCYWNSESAQTLNGVARGSRDNPKKGVGSGTDPTTGLSTSQMKQQASFVEFDFKNVWSISSQFNNGYPTLNCFPKVGDPRGNVLNTDIKTYINGQRIQSYNINNKSAVFIKDLANYGFDTVFNEQKRTTTITYNPKKKIIPLTNFDETEGENGTIAFKYVYTNIVAVINGKKIECFNIKGYNAIYFEELKYFGTFAWDGAKRESKFIINVK